MNFRLGKKVVVAGCVSQGAPDTKFIAGLSIVGVQQIDRFLKSYCSNLYINNLYYYNSYFPWFLCNRIILTNTNSIQRNRFQPPMESLRKNPSCSQNKEHDKI